MSGNANPIYSRVAAMNPSGILINAAGDYTGLGQNNLFVFQADATNGGFVQRIRYKAIGTNIATVARIFLTPPNVGHMNSLCAAPGTPAGTPSTTGGTLKAAASSYVARIQAVDSEGCLSALSTESATVTTTGATGSIAWAWTASTGAVSYRIYVGQNGATSEISYFTSLTNSFTQIAAQESSTAILGAPTTTNSIFYGELSLPPTTASAVAATVEIDYQMNIALPPGYKIFTGIATGVASGWLATVIGGAY